MMSGGGVCGEMERFRVLHFGCVDRGCVMTVAPLTGVSVVCDWMDRIARGRLVESGEMRGFGVLNFRCVQRSAIVTDSRERSVGIGTVVSVNWGVNLMGAVSVRGGGVCGQMCRSSVLNFDGLDWYTVVSDYRVVLGVMRVDSTALAIMV